MIEMRVIPAGVGVGVVLSAFTVMAGCGGATARPPVTLDQFTLQLVQTICHKIFTCCARSDDRRRGELPHALRSVEQRAHGQ
jgi:hypothetical protein